MLLTNHVLSGAVIGAAARRPVRAFALGVISHFVLDAVPHWGDWDGRAHFMRVAVRDGLTGLAVMGAMAAIAPPDTRLAVLAGMTGAALPDLDKPTVIYFGRSPFPRQLNEFHSRIQREASHRFLFEAAVGVLFLSAAVTLLGARVRRR